MYSNYNNMRWHTLDRRGAAIHYWMTEYHSTKPTVILTHGASLDHRMFNTQVTALQEAGYRVLTWDIRGHGSSKPIGEAFNLQVVVEDLEAILYKHQIEDVILVGHSFGGYVSQAFLLQHSNQVVAIAVIGCTDITETPPFIMRIAYRNMSRIFQLMPERILRKKFAEGMGINQSVQDYAMNATKQLSRDEFITVFSAAARLLYEKLDYAEEYRISKPFLLTHGDGESVERAKNAPLWAKREPNSQYEVIPNAGHNANQDNPDDFNDVLLHFLEGL